MKYAFGREKSETTKVRSPVPALSNPSVMPSNDTVVLPIVSAARPNAAAESVGLGASADFRKEVAAFRKIISGLGYEAFFRTSKFRCSHPALAHMSSQPPA
jgi:hypothetical protein